MSLKTLKDIIKWSKNTDPKYMNTFGDGDTVVIGNLKQEAIKWIKTIKKAQDDKVYDGVVVDDICVECDEYSCDNVTDWIKHFFNITEEDLLK